MTRVSFDSEDSNGREGVVTYTLSPLHPYHDGMTEGEASANAVKTEWAYPNEPTEAIPAAWFRREWVCKWVENGEGERGSECSPDHHPCHPSHGCGYYWRASFADNRWNTLQKQLRMERDAKCDSGE